MDPREIHHRYVLTRNYSLQDSADGLQHGLKPIAAACPQHVHIIDQPLLFLGALFCPFRPKQELLLAVEAAPSSVQTFFMHADIVSFPNQVRIIHFSSLLKAGHQGLSSWGK